MRIELGDVEGWMAIGGIAADLEALAGMPEGSAANREGFVRAARAVAAGGTWVPFDAATWVVGPKERVWRYADDDAHGVEFGVVETSILAAVEVAAIAGGRGRAVGRGEPAERRRALRTMARSGFDARRERGVRDLRGAYDALARFYRRRPAHRALDDAELEAIDGCRSLVEGRPGLVEAMIGSDGRVRELPDGFLDAFGGIRRMIAESGVPEGEVEALLEAIALPPGRRHGGLVELGERYHARVGLAAAERASAIVKGELHRPGAAPVEEGWLFPELPPMTLEGGEARQVRSFEGMVGEGREMRHCVGDQSTRAAYGRLFVFSLRDAAGRSTAAFSRGAGGGLRLDEVKAFENGRAPGAHVAAATAYAKAFEADGAAVEALAAAVARLGGRDGRHGEEVPRWWRREDAIAFAVLRLGHLRPFLPRAWRSMTPHAFLSGKPWRRPVAEAAGPAGARARGVGARGDEAVDRGGPGA